MNTITDEQLATALRNADKAGDTEAARKLANAIVQRRQTQSPPEPSTDATTMNVRLPNGFEIRGVPAGTSKRDIALKAIAAGIAEPEDFGGMFYTSGTIGRPMPTLDVGRMRQEYRREKLSKTDPASAAAIEDVGPFEALGIGYGEGTASLLRGVGAMDPASESDRRAAEALRDVHPMASAGKLLGQAVPFAAASRYLPSTGLAARTMAGGALGAAEGGIIARGEGGNAAQVAQGAGLGLLLGGGFELVAPALHRLGSGLIARVTGRRAAPLDAAGNPTPELQEALDTSGATIDDLVRAAEADPETIARAQAAQVSQPDAAAPQRFADTGAAPAPQSSSQSAPREFAATLTTDPAEVDNLTRRMVDKRLTPEDVQPNAETLRALDRLGLQASTPLAVASDNPAFVSVYGQMSVIPGAAQQVEMGRFFDDVNAAADNLVSRLGGDLDKDAVNQRFRARIGDLLEGSREAERELYAKLDEAIAAGGGLGVQVDASGLRQVLGAIADDLGGRKQLRRLNPQMARLLDDAETGMTFGYVDETLKKLNENMSALAPSGIGTSISKGRQKQLQKALEQVRGDHIDRLGPQAREVYEQAKRAHQTVKKLEAQAQVVLGAQLTDAIVPKLSAAMSESAVDRGKLNEFKRFMSATPEELRGEVLATALGSILVRRNAFHATGFKQWYEALQKQPQVKNLIERNLPPGGADDLLNFYKLARGVSRVQAERTKTGRAMTVLADVDRTQTFLARLQGTIGQVAAAEGISTSLGVPGVGAAAVIARQWRPDRPKAHQLASEALSDPTFREAVIDYARRGGQANPVQRRRLERRPWFREWLQAQPAPVAARVGSIGLVAYLVEADEELSAD